MSSGIDASPVVAGAGPPTAVPLAERLREVPVPRMNAAKTSSFSLPTELKPKRAAGA
jgi:hypothetical protein